MTATDEQKGTPFPEHISQALESFYNRGMVGWGKTHSANFAEAVHITGLSELQVQVSGLNDE